ncbi:alpha/beta hydrolase [Pseudodesulfovibrio sp. zrk46]|nr:alpha/beta hydrolase [Pseudodesulfovibrio sp. zrk46]
MDTAIKIIGAACLCYVAVAAWVYFNQRKMLFVPRKELVATPADIGLTYEEVNLKNGLGQRIHAWWLPHENPRFTVLFCHGNAGNISHRLETFRIFHQLGLSVLIHDYSGYGQSEGSPSEKATRADTWAAWEWLTEEKGIDPATVVLFGRSLGGAVAAELVSELTREGVTPAGAIFESTFTSVPDMGAYMYPWLPVRQLARYRYNSAAVLQQVNIPALFAHSQEDEIVPYAIGAKLYESYPGPKSFLELRGDHNIGYLEMGEDYVNGLDRYLRELEGNK